MSSWKFPKPAIDMILFDIHKRDVRLHCDFGERPPATGFNEAWPAGGSALEPLPLRHEGLSRMQELWLMHPLYSWEMLYWHHIQLDQAGLFALARRHAPLSDSWNVDPLGHVMAFLASLFWQFVQKALPEAETALGTILRNCIGLLDLCIGLRHARNSVMLLDVCCCSFSFKKKHRHRKARGTLQWKTHITRHLQRQCKSAV